MLKIKNIVNGKQSQNRKYYEINRWMGMCMKLSISNLAWETERNEYMYREMRRMGFQGLEIAPTKLFLQEPYEHIEEARRWKQELAKQWGYEICSMQSIWYGRKENIFSSEEERSSLMEYTKKAIDFAEAIDCKNLVFGCPKNRNMKDASNIEIAQEFFYKIGEYAQEHQTCVALEANPTIYNTNFLNTTKETFAFVKRIQSQGIKVNLDIGTMVWNQELLQDCEDIALINHVHISEPYLAKLKRRTFHEELLSLLESNGYDRYISIEMGAVNQEEDVIETMQYIRELVVT